MLIHNYLVPLLWLLDFMLWLLAAAFLVAAVVEAWRYWREKR